MNQLIRRLRAVEQHHDKVASYGGAAQEHHMRMQTTAVDAIVALTEREQQLDAMTDINSVFWCPQCGRGACSQEDGTCSVCGSDIILPQVVSAIARVAAAEERRSILHETGSTVTRACAALVRLSAPDDVDEHYVPRAAVVDIAMGLKRDMGALRAAAGGQGGGE